MLNLEIIKKSTVLPLLILFLILNIASRQDGATNEMSRFATMRAMAEQGTFKINDYVDWTIDWSQTPDGNYYSNKSPGAMLMAMPVFFVLDYFAKFDRKQKFKNGLKTSKVTSTPRVVISLVFQIIPFLIITLLLYEWTKSIPNGMNPSYYSLLFGALAILYGNTASQFMNFYFGHGLTAHLLMFMTYFVLKRRYGLVGLFFGFSLLNDYSVALFLPALLWWIISTEKNITWIKDFVIGGIFPGVLWVWYHTVCFGSPFKIPNMFQNPLFQDVTHEEKNLWGIFSLGVSHTNFIKLLFGAERGILFTNPWILITIVQGAYLALRKKLNQTETQLYVFSVSSFILLLIMNAQFGGWHGGGTSGPRYLSIIFPLLAFASIFLFEKSGTIGKSLFGLGLAVSVAFRALVYGSRATALNGQDLWPYLYSDMLSKESYKGVTKFSLFLITLMIATYISIYLYKRNKKSTQSQSLNG